MAITVQECRDSRSLSVGEQSSLTLRFYVEGMTEEGMAYDVLNASTPALYNNLKKSTIAIEPMETVDNDTWLGTVTYSSKKPRNQVEIGDPQFSFDVATTQTLKRFVTNYPADQQIYGEINSQNPGPEGALGFDGKTVNGVNVNLPVYTWNETHYFLFDFVNPEYKNFLGKMVGKTNNAQFRGYKADEVLFMGASGAVQEVPQAKEEGFGTVLRWEMRYKFAFSEELSNLNIGGIAVPTKPGWHHLYIKAPDLADGARVAPTPQWVSVSRIYPTGNFADLGIGTEVI